MNVYGIVIATHIINLYITAIFDEKYCYIWIIVKFYDKINLVSLLFSLQICIISVHVRSSLFVSHLFSDVDDCFCLSLSVIYQHVSWKLNRKPWCFTYGKLWYNKHMSTWETNMVAPNLLHLVCDCWLDGLRNIVKFQEVTMLVY